MHASGKYPNLQPDYLVCELSAPRVQTHQSDYWYPLSREAILDMTARVQ